MALTCSLHKAINQLVKLDIKNEIIETITAQACADRVLNYILIIRNHLISCSLIN